MQAFYLQGQRGKIFSLYYPGNNPTGNSSEYSRKAVLFFPPFAEEMNKCRHMMAKQARALSERGVASLTIDMFGTGDSEGGFGDATFDDWCSDFHSAVEFLIEQGVEEILLHGIRFGALMAVHMAGSLSVKIAGMLFWQPVLKGEVMITQFLRMKVAADMMGGGDKITTTDLKNQIRRGDFVEVAGYALNPALIEGLSGLSLDSINVRDADFNISWLEVVNDSGRPLSAASQKCISTLENHGFNVNSQTIAGESFWSTPELSSVPELVSRSTSIISKVLA